MYEAVSTISIKVLATSETFLPSLSSMGGFIGETVVEMKLYNLKYGFGYHNIYIRKRFFRGPYVWCRQFYWYFSAMKFCFTSQRLEKKDQKINHLRQKYA